MLRFALSAESVVTPDLARKLPGRGVWTSLDRRTVARAVAKQAFSRGFRKAVKASGELASDVEWLLERDALQFLSIVNKAGLVVAGAAKVESVIKSGDATAIIHAIEASADGVAKLDRIVAAVERDRGKPIARIILFESSRLDLALGRTNVIHAALHVGPASAAFLAKVSRLIAYRSGPSAQETVATTVETNGSAREIAETDQV